MLILNGKPVAEKIKKDMKKEIIKIQNKPTLAILNTENCVENLSYLNGIKKTFKELDLNIKELILKENIKKDRLDDYMTMLNNDKSINGILVLKPIPKSITFEYFQNIINSKKDIDGISPLNISKNILNDLSGFIPCTALAVLELLKYYNIDIKGKHIVIIGRSLTVGKPLSTLLLNNNATITLCHSFTNNLKEICNKGDIIVSAIGKSKYITKDYFKKDSVIIDVGINIENNKIYGDCCSINEVENIVAAMTPVPGGIGSITTSILAQNLIKAYKMQNRIDIV